MSAGDGARAVRVPRAPSPPTGTRPSLAVFKLASCDGCQLSLLDCEEELLRLPAAVHIANFTEMSSAVTEGPYDLTLVEGSITTPADAERIQEIRAASRRLVAIGACATAGGIQALRNFADEAEFARSVYPHPEYLATLSSSTPVSAHVPVDYELSGCPVDRHALLEVIFAALSGRRPVIATHSVCEDCKRRAQTCVLVATGTPCLGPVTRAGCGALCPAVGRGCYGCFGPAESANTTSLSRTLRAGGTDERALHRLFRTFTSAAPAFSEESDRHDRRR